MRGAGRHTRGRRAHTAMQAQGAPHAPRPGRTSGSPATKIAQEREPRSHLRGVAPIDRMRALERIEDEPPGLGPGERPAEPRAVRGAVEAHGRGIDDHGVQGVEVRAGRYTAPRRGPRMARVIAKASVPCQSRRAPGRGPNPRPATANAFSAPSRGRDAYRYPPGQYVSITPMRPRHGAAGNRTSAETCSRCSAGRFNQAAACSRGKRGGVRASFTAGWSSAGDSDSGVGCPRPWCRTLCVPPEDCSGFVL